MKILGMGVPELVIILIVALLIFGPKNLPKLGSALGKTVKNLRDGMGSVGGAEGEDASVGEEVAEEEATEPPALEKGTVEEPEQPEKPVKKAPAKSKATKKKAE